MHRVLMIGCCFIACFGTFSLRAEIRFAQDDLYITLRTPLKELRRDERQFLLRESINLAVERIHQLVPVKILNQEKLKMLKELQPKFDQFMEEMNQLVVSKRQLRTVLGEDIFPTAFSLYIQGQLLLQMAVGGGLGAGLGLIFMPFKVFRINKLTAAVDEYYEVDYSWDAFADAQAGVGRAVGLKAMTGIGFIFGPMEHPKQFRGLMHGIVAYASYYVGVHVMAGLLSRMQVDGFFSNVYICFGPTFSTGFASSINGRVSLVLDAEQLVRSSLSTDNQGVEGGGKQTLRKEVPEEFRTLQKSKENKEGKE